MISTKVQQILANMASFSSNAQTLVEQMNVTLTPNPVELLQSTSAETVDPRVELMSHIRELKMQITELVAELENREDATFTDEQYTVYTAKLRENLSTQRLAGLLDFYDNGFFAAQPKNIRVIVAQTLCDVCATRHFTPSPLWQTIVATNGSIN